MSYPHFAFFFRSGTPRESQLSVRFVRRCGTVARVLAVFVAIASLTGVDQASAQQPGLQGVGLPDSLQNPSSTQDPAPGQDNDDAQSELPPDLWTRAHGDDWPWFLGLDRNGSSNETGILTDWSDNRLAIRWKRRLTESYGIGSVSRGRFIQMDREGDEEVILCLNAETGDQIWRKTFPTEYSDLYGYNGGPRCSPVIDGQRVYTYGVDGQLRCLRVETGALIWHVDTADEYGVIQNFFGVGSTPVIHENHLIVMVGGSDEEFHRLAPGRLDLVEGNGSAIVAFDKRTGDEVYRLSDDLASYASLQLATIGDRAWCFAFVREGLLGFDPQSGDSDFYFPWRARSLESVNASTPIVIDDQVFISETYGPGSALLSVSPGDFEIVWQDDPAKRERAMQTHWNTPVYHNGYVYGSSGRHTANAELRCIELATGRVMWSERRLSRCSLTLIDDHLIVLGEYGQLFLIRATPEEFDPVTQIELVDDLGSGDELLLNYPAWAAPVVSHGLLYVRGDDYLVCLELIPE